MLSYAYILLGTFVGFTQFIFSCKIEMLQANFNSYNLMLCYKLSYCI